MKSFNTRCISLLFIVLIGVLLSCDKNITDANNDNANNDSTKTVDLTINIENDLGFSIVADITLKQGDEELEKITESTAIFTLDSGKYKIEGVIGQTTRSDTVTLRPNTEPKKTVTLTFPTETEPDLIAHYNFERSTNDITGQLDSGVVVGNRIDQPLGGDISYSQGIHGQAAVFDGSSGIWLPSNLITDNSYSISFEVNPEALTQFTTTFFGGIADGDNQSWISLVPMGPVNNETELWYGNEWVDMNIGRTIRTNQWSHLAVTVDNGVAKVYFNGVKMAEESDYPDVFTDVNAAFALGVNYWDPPFQGMIDELRIYDTAISPAKVAQLAADMPGAGDVEHGPDFQNVSVHDPEVAKDGDTWYLFGSHLAFAKSQNLIQWTQISGDWEEGNPLFPNLKADLQEAMEWPNPDAESTWASSVIKLNGKYYMYVSCANWNSARSDIALATSDNIDGPYAYQEILLKKYENGVVSEETGEPFDDAVDPGVIDPDVFFDANGKLWMDYGSYSGGIFIIELDPATGKPKPGQGYGTRIAGGDHAPMEGPFIQYYPKNGYYYLFLSFGTLASDGGYNIRVARSENPDGPYFDPAGNNMLDATGGNWGAVEPYGAKLIGNFSFDESGISYLSPGHNSTYYDEDADQFYIFFHTRFPGRGEYHEIRVHQLFINSEDWPVMTPHRYGADSVGTYTASDVAGTYQYINHERDIQATFGTPGGDVHHSQNIELAEDGSITGGISGSWTLTGDHTIDITTGGNVYHGVLLNQWDNGLGKHVLTFTALSNLNEEIWGSKIE